MVVLTLSIEEWALLGRCPLLRGAPDGLLCRVAEIDGASLSLFSPGQTVYSPRHFRRCLGVLLSGQLQVTKGALTISLLEPGELFGAAALYSNAPEFATTITARRSSRCLLLEQALVDRLLAEEPLIRENYLCYLTGRIRFLSGRLQSLAQSGAEGKLARYLLANGQSGSITCPAVNLAQRLGISRASLYRAFDTLEGSGLIVRRGKTISIPNLSALEGVL
ncbi:MAG: Crp/Fnr family transcriptional regulator [Lawsonibacter sp.]